MYDRRKVLLAGTAGLVTAALPALGADEALQLLLVHGRGQGGQDPKVLRAQWLETLSQGAKNAGVMELSQKVKVSFPFYGDVLDSFAREANLPLTSDIQARGEGREDSDFLGFEAEVAQSIRMRAGISDDQISAEYGDNPRPRGPTNWRWVQAIFRAIDKHGGGLSQQVLEDYTRDVFLYTTRSGVRDAIDDIVKKEITGQPVVVVGHSLGSIVAYNVLRSDPRSLNVPLFVTVGSPLGIRAVRDQLIPLKFPRPVHAWYNAFDPVDVVALYPLDHANFPVTPAIENNGNVKNHTDNHHGIVGYLDDRDVARQILTATNA